MINLCELDGWTKTAVDFLACYSEWELLIMLLMN
jgi:hypothetical protein